MKKIILFSIFCFVFSVMAVQAAGLVPCGGAGEPACNFCHLKTLAENVINFALYNIAIPVTVIFIVYGGFVILTAGESAERAARPENHPIGDYRRFNRRGRLADY